MPPLAALGGILAGAAGTSAAATAGAWGAIGAGAAATGSLIGASKQAGAATHAAELQSDASKRAETFARQQAETDWQNQERTRQANYGQWQAEQQRRGSIGSMFGLPAPNIPAYVPGVDPKYTSGATPVPGSVGAIGTSAAPSTSASPGTPGGNPATVYSFPVPPGFDPSNPVDKLVLDQFQAGIKAGKTDAGSQPTAANMSYWKNQINQTGGATSDNLAFWTSKMQTGATAGSGAQAAPGSLANYGNWNAPLSGSIPLNVSLPGSLGSYGA